MQVEPDPAGKKGVNDLYLGGVCALQGCFLNHSLLYWLGANMANIRRYSLRRMDWEHHRAPGPQLETWCFYHHFLWLPAHQGGKRGHWKGLSAAVRRLVSSNTGPVGIYQPFKVQSWD